MGYTGPPTSDRTSPPDTVFTYSSNSTSVATVDQNTGVVTIVGAGSCTITATQAETPNYTEGTATTEALTVTPAPPNIGPFTIDPQNYGTATITISAPASTSQGASNPLAFSPSSFTLTGDHVEGVGQVTIVATQAATNTYAQGIISFILLIDETIPPDEFGPQV